MFSVGVFFGGKAKFFRIFPCVNLEFRFTDDSDIFATCLQHVEDRFIKTGTLGLVFGQKIDGQLGTVDGSEILPS